MSIKTALRRFFGWVKFRKYRTLGVTIDWSASLSNVTFEGLNKIGARTRIINSQMGYGSYVANDSVLTGVHCGRYCSLGPNIYTPTGIHPTERFASTSPLFFSIAAQLGRSFVSQQKFEEFRFADGEHLRVIGNDVWLGGNVVILEGVTIGDGAVVGAGGVVTKDLPPYSISVGVPAKVIGYRFDSQTIEKLLAAKWWERDPSWIEANSDAFENAERLLEILEESGGGAE